MQNSSAPTPTPTITLLGIPFKGGQPKSGVDEGPRALRGAGIVDGLRSLGYHVNDLGDLGLQNGESELDDTTKSSLSGKAKRARWVGSTNQKVAQVVSDEIKKMHVESGDSFSLHLGGDHSVAIGTIGGMLEALQNRTGDPSRRQRDLCVVWVDAHADINTPEVSESGNIHGMPVAFLAKDPKLVSGWDIPGFEWLKPQNDHSWALNLSKFVYIGLRDVDAAEEVLLKRYNIRAYRASDVKEKGIKRVMQETLEYLGLDEKSRQSAGSDSDSGDLLHLSFDIDGIDSELCPATGTAVPEGLTVEDGLEICEACGRTGRLVGMDMVEVNPSLSDVQGAERTVGAAVRLIYAALKANLDARRK